MENQSVIVELNDAKSEDRTSGIMDGENVNNFEENIDLLETDNGNFESLDKYKKAIRNDDFDGFKKHLSQISTLGQIMTFTRRRHSEISFFEKLLNRNDETVVKYVSLILSYFNLWNNKELSHSKKAQNLFSFLMFDWFNPEPSKNSKYFLVLKARYFHNEMNQSLFETFYDIIDDKDSRMFRDVCLRIIYQLLYELGQEESAIAEVREHICINKVLAMKDQVYRDKLLQIFAVPRDSSNDFEDDKNKILNLILCEESKKFFNLAFLLKGRKNIKFEKELEEYIKMYDARYGDYSSIELKPHVRLLHKIAESESMHKTSEFIFLKCPYIEGNSTIMTNFYEVQDFCVFNVNPFQRKELNKLQSLVHNDVQVYNKIELYISKFDRFDKRSHKELTSFLFGRSSKTEKAESIFEKILKTPNSERLFKLIWNFFNLFQREEILRIKNPQGKFLLHYVTESNDDNNLLTFLMPDCPVEPKFSRHKYFLKMQNDQFEEITRRTLYEHYLMVCCKDVLREVEDQLGYKFFLVVFSLLEEVGRIDNIRETVPIDKLLELANNENFHLDLLGLMECFESPERLKEYKKKKYFIDDLLGNIVAYWTTKDENYETYKEELIRLSPFFVMAFDVIEGNEAKFVETFYDSLEKLEENFRERYDDDENVEHYTTSFLFVLLLTAMNNNRKSVIDQILSFENFITVKLKFPSNMQCNEMSYYVATKFLEQGMEIGKGELPHNWILPTIFEHFLDSRIKYDDEDLVEIDCNFLLHPHTRKYQIKSDDDVDNKLILWEDIDSLKYIMDSKALKKFITHPVVSTYIDLKTNKHRSIHLWNFWVFIFIFIVPFSILISFHLLFNSSNESSHWVYDSAKIFCPFSILYLFLRECLQFFFVVKTAKEYFKQKTNWLEIFLILFSLLTYVIFYFEYVIEYVEVMKEHVLPIVSVITTGLMTAVLLTMLPFASMPVHMMMLKTVGETFLKFFLTFVFILIAFSISFCVVFRITNKQSESNTTISQNITDNDDDPLMNFNSFFSAFPKVILMLSGEYSVEPYRLSHAYQTIFFLFFVLSSFIIFNLILGLTIDDVQRLREDARYLTLKQKAKRFIESSQKCFEIYRAFRLNEENKEEYTVIARLILSLAKTMISKYPHLHKLDKFYVDLKTGDLKFEVDRKLMRTVKQKMALNAFHEMKEIIKNRNEAKFALFAPDHKKIK